MIQDLGSYRLLSGRTIVKGSKVTLIKELTEGTVDRIVRDGYKIHIFVKTQSTFGTRIVQSELNNIE